MNYRERCYKAYVTKHFSFTHTLSKNEYDFARKIYAKKFKLFLPSNKDSAIIDVACGAGHFLNFLKKEGYTNIYGIDISKEQLKMARSIGITEVEESDLFEYLPKYTEKYEMIIANDIIEHLTKEEVLKFLDILFDRLQPGGKVLISTVNAASLFGAATVYCNFTHEQGFTATSLAQVLRICGFEGVEIYGDGPVVHDVRSFMRVLLWKVISGILRSYLIVEGGTGRGFWKRKVILEPRMFAIAKKPYHIE